MGWTCRIRARSIPSICARSAKSWAITVDGCNNHHQRQEKERNPGAKVESPGSKMASVLHDTFNSATFGNLKYTGDCYAIINRCNKFCRCSLIVAFTWNGGGTESSTNFENVETFHNQNENSLIISTV